MNTIKQSGCLIGVLWILFFLAGIHTVAAGQAGTLKFGHYADEDSALGQTARQFVNSLNENTQGRLSVEVFARSQLGSIRSMFDGVREGTLEMTLVPATYLRDIAPRMDILGLPFLFNSYEDADRVFRADSRIGMHMLEQLERGNMKGLAFWEVGFRHISNSRRPISGPWDLKGLRIRTLSDQVLVQTFRILGANPVTMPYGELYPALQMGAIDGQEGSLDTFFELRLFETQRYLSLTRHSYTALVLVMNLRTFSRLSNQDRERVMSTAQRAADWGRDFSRRAEEENLQKLLKMGVKVETDPDWYGFRKRVFYEVQEKFVREEARELLWQIDRTLR
jgi:tripartite ATP-independent transporter DctP family solute receptor